MRRWSMIAALTIAALLGYWRDANAALLGDASVPYSAQRIVTVNGRSYSGRVFHVPGHQRHEQSIQGIDEVVLLDSGKTRGWLVLPGLKTYVEFAFPRVMADLGDPALRRSPSGYDTVNGVLTTKYRIDHTTVDGTRAQGFVWISAHGVMMRLEGTVTRRATGRPATIRMELAHVQVGPQDPGLFELPPGFVKLPSGALDSLLGGGAG